MGDGLKVEPNRNEALIGCAIGVVARWGGSLALSLGVGGGGLKLSHQPSAHQTRNISTVGGGTGFAICFKFDAHKK